MAKFDDSQYHQLKKDIGAKQKFKFQNFLFDLLLVFVVVFSILMMITDGSEFLPSSWFFTNPLDLDWKDIVFNHGKNSDYDIDYFSYYFIIVPIIAFLIFLFAGKSYAETIKEYKYKKGAKGFFKRMQLKFKKSIDHPIKFIGDLLLNDLFIPLSMVDKNVRDRLGMRYGWLSHIEHSFLKRVVEKTDSYERAKELNILSDYEKLLAPKGDVTKESYSFILSFFGENMKESLENFEDIMKITEGYLTLSDSPKFDKLLTAKETAQKIKNKDIYTFRAFNKKDTVYFSFSLICRFINVETAAYQKFIKSMWYDKLNYSSGSAFTRKMNSFFKSFLNQREEYIASALFPLEDQELAIEKIKKMKESHKGIMLLAKRTVEVLPYYFRFVMMRHLLNQYTHIPSGTYVSRMSAYEAKMIVDSVDMKKLIEILPNVNDGTSKTFKSDIFVNMFLLSYYFYGDNYGTDSTLFERVETVFNFSIKNIKDRVVTNPFLDEYTSKLAGMESNEVDESQYFQKLQEAAKLRIEDNEETRQFFDKLNKQFEEEKQ